METLSCDIEINSIIECTRSNPNFVWWGTFKGMLKIGNEFFLEIGPVDELTDLMNKRGLGKIDDRSSFFLNLSMVETLGIFTSQQEKDKFISDMESRMSRPAKTNGPNPNLN